MARPDGFNTRPSTRPHNDSPSSFGKKEESVVIPKEILDFLTSAGQALKDLPSDEGIYAHIRDVQDQLKEEEKLRQKNEENLMKNLKIFMENASKETGMAQEEVFNNILKGTGGMGLLLSKNEREALLASGLSFQSIQDFKTEEEKRTIATEKAEKEKSEATKNFFSEHLKKLDKLIDNNTTLIRNTVLGPLSLLISPFEDFAGSSLFQMGKGIKEKFIKKKNPSENDLAKEGKLGPLYLWNKLKKHFGGDKEKKEGIDWKSLATKVPAGLLGSIMKGGAIAAIAAGVIWAVIDGIQGAMLAEKWGVSKVSGFIGGFLGGTGSGWGNAFKNAGKWALAGAGTGFLIAGPVGALAGGLIGAAVGGVLGFIGGEKIAKGTDKMGNFFAKTWKTVTVAVSGAFNNVVAFFTEGGIQKFFAEQLPKFIIDKVIPFLSVSVPNFFMKTIPEFVGKIVKALGYFFTKIIPDFFMKTIPGLFKKGIKKLASGSKFLAGIFSTMSNFASNFLAGMFKNIKMPQNMLGKSLFQSFDFIGTIFKDVFDFLGKQLNNIGDLLSGKKTIGQFVTDFIKNIFSFIGTIANDFINKSPIGKMLSIYILNPVSSFFSKIGDFFSYLAKSFSNPMAFIDSLRKGNIGSDFSSFMANQSKERKNAKIDSILTSYLSELGYTTDSYNRALGIESRKPNGSEGFKQGLIQKLIGKGLVDPREITSVNDAIIKPDGSIIHTSPQDTIIATKNTPATDNTRYKLPTMDTTKGSSLGTSKVEDKLDKVISLLQALLSKDPIVLPGQTRADLDAIIQGLIL